MTDYIRDLRPAKWGSMINLRSWPALGIGCSLTRERPDFVATAARFYVR
jgi:hypothetical protein